MGLWALGHQQPSFRALIGLERAMDRRRKWTRGEASFRVQKGPRCRDPPLDDGANERIRVCLRHPLPRGRLPPSARTLGYGQATGLPASRLATSSVRIPVSPKCKKGPVAGALLLTMEPTRGFEPLTYALRVRCSTS